MSLHFIFWGLFVFTTAKDPDSSGVCNVSWVNKKMRLGCCVDFQLINGDCKQYNEKNATFYGVAIFVTLVMSSLFWGGVIVVYKKYGDKIKVLLNQRRQGNIREEKYDDIRESRMMMKINNGSNSVAPLNRMTAGSCPRGSDNYHHLISTKVIPKQIHSNVYNAKLIQN
ncbi:uncharacterized protein LOC134269077 isoform X2 [Saccostrea cucullata]|uniref:uncharacterized protein LOC134269077 isoform X2 n=1 Tax=Saccostrea cuccullata TaxID=36930 RepID=UPI002ED28FCF